MKNRTILLCIATVLMMGWSNFVRADGVMGDAQGDNSAKAMEEYLSVLRSDMTFYNTENKKNYTLNEFTFDNGYEMDDPHNVYRYTFIQLYNDKVPTLVLELSANGNGAFEVLRYQEGTVYGFYFDYRALLDLSHDGTSFGSSGASDGSFQRLSIEKDICKEVRLGYSKSNSDGSVSYYIGEKKVTRVAYKEFESTMWSNMGKKEVVWNDFIAANFASASNQQPPTLLRNSGKIVPFSHIAEHGGKVYASKFQCLSGWNPVPGVTQKTGGFAVVGNALIYYCHPGYTSPSPIELFRSDLNGGNVKKITNDLDNFGKIYAVGDNIIYSTTNDDWVRTGVFCYNVKTAKNTRLLNEMPYEIDFTLVSFDDEFVYYRLSTSDEIWRVRWDGTGNQTFKQVKFPADLHQVEGDDYYCVTVNDNANTMSIHRYSISNENQKVSCTLEALPLRAIKDGWAYFFKGATIFKVDISSGKKVNLANLPAKMPESQLSEWFIVGNNLYIKARSRRKDNAFTVRLYKVPLSGGEMEYQNKEWVEYES